MVWLVSLILVTSGFQEPDRAPVSGSDMREHLANRAQTLVAETLAGREVRIRLEARWIPRQLLRLEPSSLERFELAAPPDRVVTFDVTANGRGGRDQVFQLQYALSLAERLPVANRRIEAGETIREEDLDLSWIDVERPEHRWISRTEKVSGKTARSAHRAGQPFTETSLANELVVEAGDPVRMIYRQGTLEVIVNGEARESGAVGDAIGIYSQETRRRYRATVRDPKTVIWEATQ